MEVSLWVLVDKSGRIYYTGSQEDVEQFERAVGKKEDRQVIELKGEFNEQSRQYEACSPRCQTCRGYQDR